MNFMVDGMSREQAEEMRRAGAQVWGCWWCLVESSKTPYYFKKDMTFIGHRIACPKHRNSSNQVGGFGTT